MVQFFKDGLSEMLGDGVDLLFCNDAEATSYTDTDSPEAALEKLKSVCRSAVITLGADGALVWDGEHTHSIAPLPVKAIDSNGAGDMFAGAFLYGLTHGYRYEQAGLLATKAAAELVTQFGPRLKPEQHKSLLG